MASGSPTRSMASPCGWPWGPCRRRSFRARRRPMRVRTRSSTACSSTTRRRGTRSSWWERDDVDGTSVYHLKVTKKGGPVQDYYLDTATGLEKQISVSVKTPNGAVTNVTEFSDYRTVDGCLVPFRAEAAPERDRDFHDDPRQDRVQRPCRRFVFQDAGETAVAGAALSPTSNSSRVNGRTSTPSCLGVAAWATKRFRSCGW